jgi:hypothetical protein
MAAICGLIRLRAMRYGEASRGEAALAGFAKPKLTFPQSEMSVRVIFSDGSAA